ncbi:hypothetical protein PHYBLDRAFT_69041 [Phycomyces blakesleeanus NRRL 1555(-)]|uniref:Uncharacterized protein n=1 Tax=Phycomyces blakesleeanus (strain ATCC 8743b / DSM 1359 / FGSC 10004 / NBRC 33097 / NRRL 1555) TaxID=763407 RepID=A0A167KND0_PHYB8|nr:hypothetical protein PHYBLDRAFT_69041 [Phycomyces blakesleeanus NRRL 1555(-)]OAD68489.1 hypothetical protein PHYBLDRAFT_69041 [Phycomyces blakesleeanus NRRL 1555(-)]|eukprot:XP_018286529.1 hypothetical protein PHYBLDRAFT_69041 [Phycomyces blakesleeanus NRRL 1555(-)]
MAAARPVASRASPVSIEDGEDEGEEGEEGEGEGECEGEEDENAYMNEEVEVEVEDEDEDHPKVGNEVPESKATRHAEVMGVLKQILQKMCDIEEKLKKTKK